MPRPKATGVKGVAASQRGMTPIEVLVAGLIVMTVVIAVDTGARKT
jgi:Tfp pilus assembly protein PilW